MGIVDTAKHLKRQAEDRIVPQRFVYHHVPKCGGTSVGRALRKRYILSQATVTPEESFRAFEAFTGRADREQMLVDVLDLREQMLLYHMFHDVRGLSLHVRFSQTAWERFSDKYTFVTILRDPVARFLSHYNWSHNKPHAHARIDEAFDAFLETDRARRIGATYVEYFSGLPKEADLTAQNSIEAAKNNLTKFSVIGNLANLPGFERDIRKTLGVKIKIKHENKATPGQNFVSRNDLSAASMAKVEALCAPDIAVWESTCGAKERQS